MAMSNEEYIKQLEEDFIEMDEDYTNACNDYEEVIKKLEDKLEKIRKIIEYDLKADEKYVFQRDDVEILELINGEE